MDADRVGDGRVVVGRTVRMLVTGGGTGGHTYPALTAVRTARSRLASDQAAAEVLWIGTAGGLEARIAEHESITFVAVAAGKIRRARNPLKMLSWANLSEDVVHHYQGFLDRRRQARSADEYKPVTDSEWSEFEEHFDRRKVELGGCTRPYGSACQHEHSCLRCPCSP